MVGRDAFALTFLYTFAPTSWSQVFQAGSLLVACTVYGGNAGTVGQASPGGSRPASSGHIAKKHLDRAGNFE